MIEIKHFRRYKHFEEANVRKSNGEHTNQCEFEKVKYKYGLFTKCLNIVIGELKERQNQNKLGVNYALSNAREANCVEPQKVILLRN